MSTLRVAGRWAILAALSYGSLAATLTLAQSGTPQRSGGQGGNSPAPSIDVATAKALNAAIEALNMGDYSGAQAALAPLKLDKLSPYERSRLEQILLSAAAAQEKYDEARVHLQNAINSGGLNEQEISGLVAHGSGALARHARERASVVAVLRERPP